MNKELTEHRETVARDYARRDAIDKQFERVNDKLDRLIERVAND